MVIGIRTHRRQLLLLGPLLLLMGAFVAGSARALRPEELESGLDSILVRVVKDGKVDYAALKQDPEPLDRWLEAGASLPWEEVRQWGKRSQLALCMNTYNARVLALVRDHYPISGSDSLFPASSIQQIRGVWKTTFPVARQTLSLEGLERDLLWADFHEPLIHFGMSRAALGDPGTWPHVFHGEGSFGEMQIIAQGFVGDSSHVRIDTTRRVVRLSEFFSEFKRDFANASYAPQPLHKSQGDLAGCLSFIASHFLGAKQMFLLEGNYSVEFVPFDWTLNDWVAPAGQSPSPPEK